MKSFFIGVVLATIALFQWGWIAWEVLPIHEGTFNAIPKVDESHNQDATRTFFTDFPLRAGLYTMPANPELKEGFAKLSEEEQRQAMVDYDEAYKLGPVVTIIYANGGEHPMSNRVMSNGFVINLVGVLIAAILLFCAANTCTWYIQRVLFVTLLGAFMAIMAHGNYWNWMKFPLDHTLAQVTDNIIGWTIVGLILAAFIRPRPPKKEVEVVSGNP